MPDLVFVNAINRSSKPVSFLFDGQQFTLAPREKRPMLLAMALHAKKQNPVMGSEDPYVFGSAQYLVAIEGEGFTDDLTPIDQDDEAIERFDPTLFANADKRTLEPTKHRNRFERHPPDRGGVVTELTGFVDNGV